MKNSRRHFLSSWLLAKPGYRYEFPRDHFSHPGFQTEWWYYTGNLFTPSQRRFGFELTFFRQGLEKSRKSGIENRWRADDAWLAHLALTDFAAARFLHYERLHRAGPGLAGASPARALVWNGNWHAGPDRLQAVSEDFTLRLALRPLKPPVIHGQNGVSQKAGGEGKASHYVSLTRIAASGSLALGGQTHSLNGLVWMDHEFFTHQLESGQAGWDWLSIQLDNGAELMIARIRRDDGSTDPHSHATFIDGSGRARHLESKDWTITPRAWWKSKSTPARYPIAWTIDVPPLRLTLEAATLIPHQELVSKSKASPSYWEGAMDFRGTLAASPISGRGYLEMTGYDKAIQL
jgi:predicted secreted hydrolase